MKRLYYKLRIAIENFLFPERGILWKIISAVEKFYFKSNKDDTNYEKVANKVFKTLRLCEIRKIRKCLCRKRVVVYLCRQGIFIGKQGELINFIKKEIGYDIVLKELKKDSLWIEESYKCYAIAAQYVGDDY